MTVETTNTKIEYSGNGETTAFPVPFPIFTAADIDIDVVAADGTITRQVLNVGYTVAITNPNALPSVGSVVMLTAPANGEKLAIYRDLPVTQEIVITDGGPLPASAINEAHDRAVLLIQQLSEMVGRSVMLSRRSPYSGLSIPDPAAGQLMRWKDDLAGLENVPVGNIGLAVISDFARTLLEDADAATAFANIKQSATETTTGVSRRATMAEAIDGEGNEAHVTPMEAAAMAEAKVNPKSQSQGISKAHETAGFYVPDNANLRIGTGDMAMIVKAASPNWTKNIHTRLIDKFTSVVQKAPAAGSNPLRAATVFNDKIYSIGSGALYEWNGVDAWVSKAPAYLAQTAFYDITIFNNELYSGSFTAGYLFKWNGVDAWVSVAAPIAGYKINAMSVFNNELYAIGSTTTGSYRLMKWDGVSAWVHMVFVSDYFSNTLFSSFCMKTLLGKIYILTVSGQLLEYDAVANTFTTVAQSVTPNAGNSYACGLYNGVMYMCTDGGALYTLSAVNTWDLVLPTAAHSSAVAVSVLTEHNGFLYCGLRSAGGASALGWRCGYLGIRLRVFRYEFL